jgi:hypothetical protein
MIAATTGLVEVISELKLQMDQVAVTVRQNIAKLYSICMYVETGLPFKAAGTNFIRFAAAIAASVRP